MYLVPPYLAALTVSWGVVGEPIGQMHLGDVVNFGALAVILAGAFLVARYKAALEVSVNATAAWREERDAAVSHAERLTSEIREKDATIAALESRPSLEKMEALMERLVEATVAHEAQAAERHDRMYEHVKGIRGAS